MAMWSTACRRVMRARPIPIALGCPPRPMELVTRLDGQKTASKSSLSASTGGSPHPPLPMREAERPERPERPERLFIQVDLELRAHQPAVLKSYAWFLEEVARILEVGVLVSEGEEEPHKVRKTLLKPVFAHSKHRVQYEMRTYYWVIQLSRLTQSTRDTYLEYVQRNLPEGVSMVVRNHEIRPLPQAILNDLRKRETPEASSSG
ncbi:hypothetical protein TCAL_00436 [Tigriopus californicus]|uniref:Small ribosomal subunit protein uS10m n=1 Tax=Tigriopus californicus TaxID=6832 RepID=A0A553NEJ7_TIGCA|nr:small ribosomal subunit protein uS10m-like [Tigriopus californicus]TRY63828.1 hypothetical protein TCAL_00436 [Tigriopus californicus]|eukprot:TCALIF_00436-PA protein Name:"Similar to mRpS10 28S ribosomal protein S10, mitochondrial (Drosophila melanogaster)" AED:0.03 eAED:0.03 QI:0/-1/0/1/-1/1/1/0/204